ncbi:type II toxin-antitoxin system HipA family toxin [Herbaspirillum rubrisubalbicans Os34]|uniref:Type II toxin-antitoxin system HipA family toxin n=1 Tax=Herbaspirillum rubrisubalbicans Os34 TaxID=1235827 RepID=A0A6M3ZYY0_9BURK|nr:HipA domain-containing protein [Herbaspirillum rubrisubalbicans]QJQ03423.1 type II toxin-antitoxin system HipA family toxin [Herbaspirillum rubrisubalbicans Os34]
MAVARLSPAGNLVLSATYGRELIAAIESVSRDEQLSIEYSRQWLNSPDRFPLSWRIPIGAHANRSRDLKDHLCNLLPEGMGLQVAATRYQVALSNVFALSMYLLREPAGAIGFALQTDESCLPDEEEPIYREVRDDELSMRIRGRAKRPFSFWDGHDYRGLAGSQDKIQVMFADDRLYLVRGSINSTHVLKPETTNPRAPMMVANEHFCMSLAAALGLSVAKVEIKRTPEPVLLVERFDRKRPPTDERLFLPGQVERLHTIDACQAMGTGPKLKYECPDGVDGRQKAVRTGLGFRSLFGLSGQFMVPNEGRMAILRWAIFNLLIGNSDAHAKNFSFFQNEMGIMPAPYYDLVSTAVYSLAPQMAMVFGDTLLARDVSEADLIKFAAEAGTAEIVLAQEIRDMASAAMVHAPELAKMDAYLPDERELLAKIVEIIARQGNLLLSIASSQTRAAKLGLASHTKL